MTLVGLMAMIDPPREEVYEAVREAKKCWNKNCYDNWRP